ncbi:MAG TPA: hydroxysqualene dehydroxylase HpnE [Casimicrobiaceae bacterium]|jgi:squalene-associated FAD-dependent desaturase
MKRSVAVIGGGWAGCAAAVTLARGGDRVTLYEAAPVLGGRARTVTRDGLPLDNGQHVLLGAYTATHALAAVVHAGRSPFVQIPLALRALVPRGLQLRARPLPGSLGLAAALMCARGLSWRERMANARWFAQWQRRGFRCAPDATVTALMSTLPTRAAAQVWAPLCVAALNTPPARASGQVFLNVLAAAFGARRDASDLVMPAESLGATLPDAAAEWLAASGHAVRRGVSASIDEATDDGVRIVTSGDFAAFDAAVVAVGPHQLARAFSAAMAARPPVASALQATARFAYESITTIYLGYRGAHVSVPSGLVRLDDDPGQWLFERADVLRNAAHDAPTLDQLFAVVISTSGPHDDLPQADLVQACDAQLRRARPALPPLAWSQVIAERRATYACTPRLAHPGVALVPRVCLAGDYVYARFPATLESAVRSGEAAAAAL